MFKFSEVAEYLNDEYPYAEDVFGLVLDLVNGSTELEDLVNKIKEYKEHN